MRDWKNTFKTWENSKALGLHVETHRVLKGWHLLYGLQTAHPLKAYNGAYFKGRNL